MIRTAAAILFLSMIAATLLSAISLPAIASGQGALQIVSTPDVILADGKSTTTVSVTARDANGNTLPDGTPIQFFTTLGLLSSSTAETAHGVARVTLTSSSTAGEASITVTAFGNSSGSATGVGHVTFTDNPDAVFAGGQAGWVHVECPEYLVYSADHKIVEAQGSKGSVHFRYRTLNIQADAIQIDLDSQSFIARNAVMSRGKHSVHAIEMRYDLTTSGGVGVCDRADGHGTQSETITGYSLDLAPEDPASANESVVTDQYRFVDISDSQVIISAKSIAVDPGKQLQFTRATIYNGGKKVVSVPYHIMPLGTTELFGQQVLGFGTEGFFVNVPLYYHVAPGSIGTIFIRNSAVNGATDTSSATGNGIPSIPISRSGLELDMEHSYTLGNGGTGTFFIDGITRGGWGAHWNQSERFNASTNSYFYLDSPDHRTLFGSSNLTHQFTGCSLNFAMNASHDPGEFGYSSNSTSIDTYLQINSHRIGRTGINYATTLSAQNGITNVTSSTAGHQSSTSETYDIGTQFNTNPLKLDKRTTLNDSLSLGESWDRLTSQTSPTVQCTLGLLNMRPKQGTLNANYSYRYDPFQNRAAGVSTAISALEAMYTSSSQHRLNLSFNSATHRGFSYGFFSSYGLPTNESNLFTNLNYQVNKDWGLGLQSNYAHILFNTYRDTELSVSRRFIGRNIVFSYSTLSHHVSVNLGAGAL